MKLYGSTLRPGHTEVKALQRFMPKCDALPGRLPGWRGRHLRLLAALPPNGDAENLKKTLEHMVALALIESVCMYSAAKIFM